NETPNVACPGTSSARTLLAITLGGGWRSGWIVTDIFVARYASFVRDGSNVRESRVNALLAQNLNVR
ncbi:hypothetical protein, partial [Thermogutta sp.]|uniref:hypothetical protein n=1 Tax=Thermogutta sp. TaxID=1962930 RepID=UPI0025CC2341